MINEAKDFENKDIHVGNEVYFMHTWARIMERGEIIKLTKCKATIKYIDIHYSDRERITTQAYDAIARCRS